MCHSRAHSIVALVLVLYFAGPFFRSVGAHLNIYRVADFRVVPALCVKLI